VKRLAERSAAIRRTRPGLDRRTLIERHVPIGGGRVEERATERADVRRHVAVLAQPVDPWRRPYLQHPDDRAAPQRLWRTRLDSALH
jgi:hypothetical protein